MAVITSYSIHYTKLYDRDDSYGGDTDNDQGLSQPQARRQAAQGTEDRRARLLPERRRREEEGVHAEGQPRVDRISSYNVCYTKLLRM